MRFVPRSVMTGFVNALAILIFLAQMPELIDVPAMTYPLVAAGSRSSTAAAPYQGRAGAPGRHRRAHRRRLRRRHGLRTVGDMGELPDTLPMFLIPDIPLTLETLQIILPYSAAVAVVGLLESPDDRLHRRRAHRHDQQPHRECIGQGVANTATGFIGGMAGCAMIGQSMINVKSGGRGGYRRFAAGIFLLFLILVLERLRSRHPDGGAGRDHDHGLGRHLLLVLDQEPAHHPKSSSVVMITVVGSSS
jgi:SulP family sulfate permease